eukprot:6782962-Prymnesium_polylepis.1
MAGQHPGHARRDAPPVGAHMVRREGDAWVAVESVSHPRAVAEPAHVVGLLHPTAVVHSVVEP